MDNLEQYLTGEYLKEKDLQISISELILKVISSYQSAFDTTNGFRYQIGEVQTEFSSSTTAMVTSSISMLFGKPDLVKYKNDSVNYFKIKFKKDEEYAQREKNFREAIELLVDRFKKGKPYNSVTFGDNAPLILLWVKNIVDNNQDNNKDILDEKFIQEFQSHCVSISKEKLKSFYDDFKVNQDHVFPLLKFVQLYKSLGVDFTGEEEVKHLSKIRSALQNSLLNHLSQVSIENSNFDAAELIFSLEGLLLLDPNIENFDNKLLDRVFQVIKDKQEISHYWRPLKPIKSDSRGFALLPLSIETAMSLIRVCKILHKKGEELFSNYFEIFKKYTDWLMTRVAVFKDNYGWCSEHVYTPNTIHPWETSQVMVYLVRFNEMLQTHIANKSFAYANLSTKWHGNNGEAWTDWEKGEPLKIPKFDVYADIRDRYLGEKAENYSMLLYGPPGTGKSTIAEKIAETKGWPLITITPSDFVIYGADKIEIRAKYIFKMLEEQKDFVVLFDEIDRLILDRDSEFYDGQGDMFQLMTPSMLVKLKDLRKKEKIIFVIATNYNERIDMAIKRKGRIDKQYLVVPHSKPARAKMFNENISGKVKEVNEKFIQDHEKLIVSKTALYTHTEFMQLSKEICADEKGLNENKLAELMEAPSISLMSYQKKLGLSPKEKTAQKATKEFLPLVYLKAESRDKKLNIKFEENELKLILELLRPEFHNRKPDDNDITLDKLKEGITIENLRNELSKHLNNDDMVQTILSSLEECIPPQRQ